MNSSERDVILTWMSEYAWNLSPVPDAEIAARTQSALQMRRRLNDLYDAEAESAAYRFLTFAGRVAGLAGLGILAIDLLTMSGAGPTLVVAGSWLTGIGGAKELLDVYYIPYRTEEKRWIHERRKDVDRYLGRLA